MKKKIFKIVLLILIWKLIFVAGFLFYYSYDMPDFSSLDLKTNKPKVQFFDRNHQKIFVFGEEYRQFANYHQLPVNLINAVVATEDRRFFKHFGFDIIGIIRAIFVNSEAGRIVQGGSTITQQLAKISFLKPERTLKRKVQELLLAIEIEKKLTKEEIITNYLNRAYFGSGNYGVVNAARFYFNKNVSNLNLNESAMLAGILKAPSKLSPKVNPELANQRKNVVIQNLINEKYLDKNKQKSLAKNIKYNNSNEQSLYFVDAVREELQHKFVPIIGNHNVAVETTLDLSLQKKFIKITTDFANQYPQHFSTDGSPDLTTQIAVVAINRQGEVVSMIGGIDYQQSQFNRAIKAKRQVGSLFKTILYLAAFEQGLNNDEIFDDRKTNIGGWSPDNHNHQYQGEITLDKAFAQSINSVAVQLAMIVGNRKIIETAKNLGLNYDFPNDDATIALGTSSFTLFDFTRLYATIANDGKSIEPYLVKKINNEGGVLLFENLAQEKSSAINIDSIEKIRQSLSLVISDGTAKDAKIKSDAFGKTGTSQNYRDAWFIGFDNNLTIGIWMGNDNNKPTKGISGGTLPAKLFANLIAASS
jgi:penicillin-binding protein 1A